MAQIKQILIEGYTPEEILNHPDEQIDAFVFTGGPIVFKAGSAEILGEFTLAPNSLIVELAQIEGGGEGVLPTLWVLAEQYALRRGLEQVEWVVHALNCAKPNMKLKRVLDRLGFVVKDVPGYGSAYYYAHKVPKA